MAVLRCGALYLSNSTLAWAMLLVPYRVAFHGARSRSDHTCISNSAAEDLNIRPAGSLGYRNDTSRVAVLLG